MRTLSSPGYADRVQFKIEKLIYGGDGLARIPAIGDERRGKTVFVPYVAPGELVEATVVEEHKGYTRAALAEVLTASPERTAPKCPHFGVCGGCHYQHLEYGTQLQEKRRILAGDDAARGQAGTAGHRGAFAARPTASATGRG